MDLKQTIKNNEKIIEEAKKEYIIALRKYEAIKNPIEREHNKILQEFRAILNKEIEKDNDCHCCSPRYYDDVYFEGDGIGVMKDANHPNDRVFKNFTWDEVENIFNKEI